MLKMLTQLEHTIEGKVGKFLCDPDLSTVHAKEMLFQFLKYIGQIEDQGKAQTAPVAPVQEPASPVESSVS
jgi:hypothetical protein